MKSIMLDCPNDLNQDTLFKLDWDSCADGGRGAVKLKPVSKADILKQMVMVEDYCQGHREQAIPAAIVSA